MLTLLQHKGVEQQDSARVALSTVVSFVIDPFTASNLLGVMQTHCTRSPREMQMSCYKPWTLPRVVWFQAVASNARLVFRPSSHVRACTSIFHSKLQKSKYAKCYDTPTYKKKSPSREQHEIQSGSFCCVFQNIPRNLAIANFGQTGTDGLF